MIVYSYVATGQAEDDVRIENGMISLNESGTYYVDLVVVGDQLVENNEEFTVEIVPANSFAIAGDPQTFTIIDDDGMGKIFFFSSKLVATYLEHF